MGKARFYDRFLFVLLTATAFLISGIASAEKDGEIKEEKRYATNEYNLLKILYTNYRDEGSDFPWKKIESEENATKLSDDQFVDGKALIDLPFGIQLFDLNVTRVAVTKQGTIQSEYPSVNWIIAPLNVESGITRCDISYLFQENNLYVQWNNFRFNLKYFEERDFSFQVMLSARGEIDFVYKRVPFHLTDLRENCDCLGGSFGVMYPYEEVFKVAPFKETYDLGFLMDLDEYEVKQGTVVRFFPADECMFRKNCHACTETKFQINPKKTARCLWCPAIQKCSSRRDEAMTSEKMNGICRGVSVNARKTSIETNPSLYVRTPKKSKAKRMGKAQFHDRFIFILLTAAAFLVSGIASTEKDNETIKELYGHSFYETDKYYSMKIHYFNKSDTVSDIFWKEIMDQNDVTVISDDQFVDGKALIDVPFGFKFFDLNVTRVAVTKEGTIQSADPSVNWTIAPLQTKFGMSRCYISYLVREKNFYVQWNNFLFNHESFKEYEFSFQVRLGDRGEIDFDYRSVPYNMTDYWKNCDCLGGKFGVMYSHHEVFEVPRPYHETHELGFSMDFENYEVQTGTVIRFFPADWCMGKKNCYDCTTTEYHLPPNKSVRCSWCPAIEKCSSTRDSLKHVWKENKCNIHHVNDPISCSFDAEGNGWLYFVLLAWTFKFLVITCIFLHDKIVKVCYTIRLELLRERFQSTIPPNEPVDLILGECENNHQFVRLDDGVNHTTQGL
ncbi:Hypothetical predicted protein [Cloeon dipterum]|uniref:Uncharacterized protein n=1 Tax=Cloeon dipterum TaxID=197152 RepID=A0A8S1DC20_9INSE|nr:Hypothetical predicted protein [Cloeon dipterum]